MHLGLLCMSPFQYADMSTGCRQYIYQETYLHLATPHCFNPSAAVRIIEQRVHRASQPHVCIPLETGGRPCKLVITIGCDIEDWHFAETSFIFELREIHIPPYAAEKPVFIYSELQYMQVLIVQHMRFIYVYVPPPSKFV